ncbi:MAG: hypothetical protein WBJ21_08995, partial [Burkholderiaceae bacterium]
MKRASMGTFICLNVADTVLFAMSVFNGAAASQQDWASKKTASICLILKICIKFSVYSRQHAPQHAVTVNK